MQGTNKAGSRSRFRSVSAVEGNEVLLTFYVATRKNRTTGFFVNKIV